MSQDSALWGLVERRALRHSRRVSPPALSMLRRSGPVSGPPTWLILAGALKVGETENLWLGPIGGSYQGQRPNASFIIRRGPCMPESSGLHLWPTTEAGRTPQLQNYRGSRRMAGEPLDGRLW